MIYFCWHSKEAPVSLADSCSSLASRIPAYSHSQMLFGHLLCCFELGSLVWGWNLLLLLGKLCCCDISPKSQPLSFSCLHPSYQSCCSFFCKSLITRLLFQLVFSWLFRLIGLYFSCYSSLVLGGGECLVKSQLLT